MEQVNTKSVCGGCQVHFSGRSVPEFCTDCNLHYHKSKCFNSTTHPCIVRKRSKSCSNIPRSHHSSVKSNINAQLPPPSDQSIPPVTPVSSLCLNPSSMEPPLASNSNLGDFHQAPPTKPSQSYPDQSSATQPSSQETVLASSGHVTPPVLRFQSVLDPEAQPFENQPEPSKTTDGKTKSKKSKNTLGGEGLELEYARYEVNITQAKIREQETKIKDLEFRNRILEARVQDLEKKQKQEIYEKYFPKPSNSQNSHSPSPAPDSTNSFHSPTTAVSSTCCSTSSHLVLSCCSCHDTHGQRGQVSTATNNQEEQIINLSKQLKEISDNNTILHCRMDTLTDITLPQNLRASYNNDDLRSQHVSPVPDTATKNSYEQPSEDDNDAESSIDLAMPDDPSQNLNC